MKLFVSVFCLFISCIGVGIAQDTQYSQFFAAPLKLNPALTAFFDGNFRLSAINRDQWRRALEKPINSFTFNGDMRFKLREKAISNPDFWGAGITFSTDRAGDFGLNTTNLSLSAAFHKALDRNMQQYLSAGIQLGIFQRNLSYGNVFFQDQFDGVNTYTLPTAEFLPSNNFGYTDFSAGLHYTITPVSNFKVALGGAVHHILEPNTSFYSDATISGITVSDVPLFRKYQAHLAITYVVTESFSYTPRIMYVSQGKHQQALVGLNLRYEMVESNGRAFQIGTWLRPVKDLDNYDLAAVVLMFGIEFNQLNIGLSYDASLSALGSQYSRANSFEISLRYIGEYQNDSFFCPEF